MRLKTQTPILSLLTTPLARSLKMNKWEPLVRMEKKTETVMVMMKVKMSQMS